MQVTSMSSSGYPNFPLMTSTLGPARLAAESKARTYPDRLVINERRASGGARVGDGWAAISQDGQGVGTEPIYATVCVK
jgi:hypothetical protein